MRSFSLAAFLLYLVSASASAADSVRYSAVAFSAANEAVKAAVAKCEADGYKVSAAVVGPTGVLVSQGRADGAGAHTIDSSFKKAYTSASLKEPTQKLAELIAKIPSIAALRDMNDSILMLGGGFPIVKKGELLGAIGVGGAPGSHLDEACARAGLRSLSAELFEGG